MEEFNNDDIDKKLNYKLYHTICCFNFEIIDTAITEFQDKAERVFKVSIDSVRKDMAKQPSTFLDENMSNYFLYEYIIIKMKHQFNKLIVYPYLIEPDPQSIEYLIYVKLTESIDQYLEEVFQFTLGLKSTTDGSEEYNADLSIIDHSIQSVYKTMCNRPQVYINLSNQVIFKYVCKSIKHDHYKQSKKELVKQPNSAKLESFEKNEKDKLIQRIIYPELPPQFLKENSNNKSLKSFEQIQNDLSKILTERELQVFILKVFGEMKFKELGESLNIETGTARNCFHSAKKKLKKVIHNYSDK